MALKFLALALFVAAVCGQQQQSALGPQLIQQQAQPNQQNVQQNQQQQNRDQNQQQQNRDQNQQNRDQNQQIQQQLQQVQQQQQIQQQQAQQHLQQVQQQQIQQVQQQQQHEQADRYEHDPQYDYSYIVQDNLTGDNKQQEESRRGGRVRGQYSLIDADGFRRIVDYRADDHSGFNAEVRREPIAAGRVQRIEQRIEQIDRQQQQQLVNQQQQHHQQQQNANHNQNQNQNQQRQTIEQTRQSIQNTIQRIEVPVLQSYPRSIYTVQEFVAPSYSAVRQSVQTNRQDDNSNNQQQQQQQQHQESRFQARLTFRSPGINYQY